MRRPFVAAVAFALAACGPDFEQPRVAVSQPALPTLTGWGTNPGGRHISHNSSSLLDSSSCMQGTKSQPPQQWGDLVRGAYPGYTGAYPRVAVYNGDMDYTVNVKNLTELMKQWTNVLGVDQTADATSTVTPATH